MSTFEKALNHIQMNCFHLEPQYGRFSQGPFGAHGGGETLPPDQGLPQRYGNNMRRRRPKTKNLEPSAPPDKDPVMLLNEYGQKRDQLVRKATYSGTLLSKHNLQQAI